MRQLLPVIALVLIAGCKGEAPAPQSSEDAAVASTVASLESALPPVAVDARSKVKYAGSYSQTAGEGKDLTLKLNADDSYEWTGADGKTVKGKIAWSADGSRIVLDGAPDAPAFAVADGAVYKLASKDAPTSGLTSSQMLTRAPV